VAGNTLSEFDLRDGVVVAHEGASEKWLDAIFEGIGTAAIEEYAEFSPDGASPKSVMDLYRGTSTLTGGADIDSR
jgi:xanthine dehydrogenase YagR molybdenum-binding subunit